MKIERLSDVPAIKPYQTVRLKICGNISEVMARQHNGKTKPHTRKISKDNYMDMRTGEVYDFKHHKSRADDLQSVSRSLALGRDMLNANIEDVRRCRWITLTYAENMTDPKKLHEDFKYFNKKCRKMFGHYEYITAAEPQGRGAWHLHVVLIFPKRAPFMPNDVVAQLWGHGFVTVKKLEEVDNVGAYLTAYLGDMELTEENAADFADNPIKTVEYEEDGKIKSKRFIKGARLVMYPPGFNIFRYSRGVKKPIIEETTYKEAKEKACGGAQTFSKAIKLEDEKGFSDTLVYEYYNTLRAKSQENNENCHTKSEEVNTEKRQNDTENEENFENEVNNADLLRYIFQVEKDKKAAKTIDRSVNRIAPGSKYNELRDLVAAPVYSKYDYSLKGGEEYEEDELPF